MKKITFNAPLNHKAYSYEPMQIEVEKIIPLYGKRFEQMRDHPLEDTPEIIEKTRSSRSTVCFLFVKEVKIMKIRVFQIDHEKDEKNLAFRDYQTALAKNGRIDESIYKQVYGGEVPCKNLEEVYALCNGERKPLGYIAESMSVSNVVEVTENNNHCCFYVDSVGFKMVDFDTSKADRSDMMRIIILENEKVPYEAEISHDIHAMQNVVDGYIEAIYFTPKDDAIVYCNDEFLLHDYAPNRFVGEILVHGTFFIVGNTRNDDGEWESCSLTDEQIAKYTEQFWGYLVPIQKMVETEEECDESEDIGLSQI